MPFGDTAKKVQRLSTIAEQTYEKLNQLVAQLQELRESFESTSEQIESMDRELAEQRAIVEALAEEQGVDVDGLIAEQFPEEAVADSGENGAPGDAADEPGDGQA